MFKLSAACIIFCILLCQGSPLTSSYEFSASEIELIVKLIETKDSFDLLLNLLPLYGHLKLKYLIRDSSYDSLVVSMVVLNSKLSFHLNFY